ncbi:DUF2777 family protein [Peribacillus frigoritolerans]|nr:DUF2777 family protein [Peribacillus frigoritolerans]
MGKQELLPKEQWKISINNGFFFDDETDEACSIEDHVDSIIEVYRGGRWQQGVIEEEGKILLHREITFLRENEPIRIRKKLLYSFERLLEELNDDSFFQFVTTLNSLDFFYL